MPQISSANIIIIGILTPNHSHTRHLYQSQLTSLNIDSNNNKSCSSRLSSELNRILRSINSLRNTINLRRSSSNLRTHLSLSLHLTPGINKPTWPYLRIESPRTNCPPTRAWITSSYWIRWESEWWYHQSLC
jgi:hypothetical protein